MNDVASGTLTPADAPATVANGSRWQRFDALLERLGDRLNPILVKEARQALKSRQFTVTFGLLLLCAWGWSLIAVGIQAEQLSYGGAAIGTFIGYLVILIVPAMVIVPFAAFQSLSGERDEGTLDLLSITTLSARQIVRGKLASAVLQLMVYFSALSPCLAFTYLLRGLDILTIAAVLMYTFLFSLVLCSFGLMLATLTTVPHLRVMLSGLFVVGLVIGTWCWAFVTIEGFLRFGMGIDEPDFWIISTMLVSFLLSFLFLFLAAASAQMSFASDNRSTRLRVIMLVQQSLLIGWFSYMFLRFNEEEILYAGMLMAGIYWAVMGALMSSETAELSPRVKRSLPRSALARVLLTWFNPGSGTGYVFALSNLVIVMLTFWMLDIGSGRGAGWASNWLAFATLLVCYVAAYLGVGRLLILLLRRNYRINMLSGFLVQAVMVGLGGIVSTTLQLSMYRIYGDEYTYLQLPNWGWTLMEVAEQSLPATVRLGVMLGTLLGVAIPVMIANLALASREVAQTRIEAPQRVLEDEAMRQGKAQRQRKAQ